MTAKTKFEFYKTAEIKRLERLFAARGRPCIISWPDGELYGIIDFWQIDRRNIIMIERFNRHLPLPVPSRPRNTWAEKIARQRTPGNWTGLDAYLDWRHNRPLETPLQRSLNLSA